MTERTVRSMAKELAGEFYDQQRSARFRKENPSQDRFVALNWESFVDLARQTLTKMLTSNSVSEHLKVSIYEALIEDNKRSTGAKAKYVPQATLEPVEKEDRKMIDANPQLITSRG